MIGFGMSMNITAEYALSMAMNAGSELGGWNI